jgi:CheY-like chemotaxis protein
MAETNDQVILVVDDNSDHRKGFRILLESGGYSRFECNSGKEALTALDKTNFDLMTLRIFLTNDL